MENRLLNDNELEQAQGGLDMTIGIAGMIIAILVYNPEYNTGSEQGDFSSSTYYR